MENYSRYKKNEELYERLHSDNENEISSEDLSRYANRLHDIDGNHFDRMEPEAVSLGAIHARRNMYLSGEPAGNQGSFNNEYLDEFIDEVKQYNIKKGLRTAEDTQANILNEIRGRYSRPEPQMSLDSSEIQQDQEENIDLISSQIIDLMNGKELTQDSEDETVEPSSFETMAAAIDETEKLRDEFLEETSQLKQVMDQYEEKLTDVHSQMSVTKKLLNVILALVFIALLVVLAGLAYYLLLERGLL